MQLQQDTEMKDSNQFELLSDNLLAQSADCHTILQNKFHHNSFRKYQLDIILNTINDGDTLAVLPTGSGKSICYQIPALYLNKPALIISPLVSLIKDQMDFLSSKSIPTTTLSKYNTMMQTSSMEPLLIYATPESLSQEKCPNNWTTLKQIHSKHGFCLFGVDEAHLISTWGNTFRESYKNLHNLRDTFPKIPCLAVTATATNSTQDEIVSELKMG
eukprot:470447_1